jgi:hypothetical protein
MKTTVLSLIVMGASFSSFAIPFQWVDSDQDVRVLTPGGTISDRFDIRFSDPDSYMEIVGFQPGIDVLSSATVGFKFSEQVSPVDWTAGLNWQIFASGAPFSSTVTVNGVPVLFSLTGPLASNGFLDYTLTYQGQGTLPLTLTKAWLSANGQDNVSVPDGGTTMMLLGSATLGLAFLRRKGTSS